MSDAGSDRSCRAAIEPLRALRLPRQWHTAALKVDGRISFSGTRLWPGYGINYYADLAKIRAPFLYLGTRNDWRAPLKEALGTFRRIGAHDKRTAFYPGTWHGWDLVTTAPFAQ